MKKTAEQSGVVLSETKVAGVVAIPKVKIRLTRDQLVNILFGVKGVTFIGADTTTIPDMNKGGREHLNYMHGNVVKDSTIRCMLGADYAGRRDTIAENEWVADAVAAAIAAGVDPEMVTKSVKTMKEYSEKDIEKFVPKKRIWGKHMLNPYNSKISRIMVHHTKLDKETRLPIPETYKRYMQVEILGADSPVYRYKDTREILSDTDLACVKKYLSVRSDDDLIIRDYCVENINVIRINKNEYELS